jgi:hypothetical protein
MFREEAVDATTKTLVRIEDGYGDPLQVTVYNWSEECCPGDIYAWTELAKSGTRYVKIPRQWPRYVQAPAGGIPAGTKTGSDETLEIVPGEAECTLVTWQTDRWVAEVDGYGVAIKITVYNPWDAVEGGAVLKVSAGPDCKPTPDVEECETDGGGYYY